MALQSKPYETMNPEDLRSFLRGLQKEYYNWPNLYFAWEKPDKSLFMVGVRSTQLNHLLKYELEPDRSEHLKRLKKELNLEGELSYNRNYVAYLYNISPTCVHMQCVPDGPPVQYDPVEKLVGEVGAFKYLGAWEDPDRFMKAPGYSQRLAHGRWDLAKEHILGREYKMNLDDRISRAGERAANTAGRESVPDFEPER